MDRHILKQSYQQKRKREGEDGYEKQSETLGFLDICLINDVTFFIVTDILRRLLGIYLRKNFQQD